MWLRFWDTILIMDKSDLINSPIKEYERLLKMDYLIRAGNFPSPEYLSKELEVTKRAIFRYRNILIEDFGAPLKVSKKYGGYYYEDPDFTISDITLNKHESLVLQIAKRLSDMMLYGSELYKSFSRGITSLNNRAAKSSSEQGKVIADRIQFAFPHTDLSITRNWNSTFENIIFNSLQDGTLLKFEIEDLDAHDSTNLINLTALPVYIVMFEESWLLLCIKEDGFKNNFSEIEMKPENFILFDIVSIHSVSEYKDSHAKIIKIPTSISSEGRDGPTYASQDMACFEPIHKIWFDFSIAFNTFKDSEDYIVRLIFLRKGNFSYEITDDILIDAAHKGQGKFDNIEVNTTDISTGDILI